MKRVLAWYCLLALCTLASVSRAQDSACLSEPTCSVLGVHQLQEDSLNQLLQPFEVSDKVRSSMPLQHAGWQPSNMAGWGKYDSGSAITCKVWRKTKCWLLQKFKQEKINGLELEESIMVVLLSFMAHTIWASL